MKSVWILAASCVALSAGSATAHPGGLNAEGCHNDRRNGGYHCHRGNGSSGRSTTERSNAPARPLVGSGVGVGSRTRYFANCSEARAAGAAPIRRGEPGYASHLDRDGDGVACER